MRKIRNTLARLRPSWQDPRRRCVRRQERQETAREPDPPVPGLPEVKDLIKDRNYAKMAEEHGNLMLAELHSDRARRGGILLAAHRWSERPPVIPMAESAARHFRLELVGDRLPDGTVLAHVPTLRTAIELYRLRFCCGANLVAGGDDHECRWVTPENQARRQQNDRTVTDLLMHGNSIGVCLECAGVCDGAECPTVLTVEEYPAPLADDLNPAMIAIAELPR